MSQVDLLALSDEEFRSVVDGAVRNRDPEDDDARAIRSDLLRPEIVDKTYFALIASKKSVEGQLAAKRADYVKSRARTRHPDALRRIEETYRGWRAGALRFKSGVEEFLVEVRAARDRNGEDNYLRKERNDSLVAFEQLRRAVIEHRDHVCGPECDNTCIADENLWRLVDA